MAWIVDRDNGLLNMNKSGWAAHTYSAIPCMGDPIDAPVGWFCTQKVLKDHCTDKAIVTCTNRCEGFHGCVQAWCAKHDPRLN